DAARVQQVEDRAGVHLDDVPHEADVDLLTVDHGRAAPRLEQSGVLAGEAHGVRGVRVQEAHELARHLAGEDHADDVHRLGRRDAQPTAELAGDVQPVEHRVDLGPSAVHDDGPDPDLP